MEYLKWENNKFVKSEKYGYNTQSTYLYFLLNGFSLGVSNDIIWVDDSIKSKKELEVKTRKNVFKSKNEFVYKKKEGERCDRKWSFTRTEQV